MGARAASTVIITLLGAALMTSLPGTTQAQDEPEQVVSGGFVVDIQILEDGTILYGELQGDVKAIDPDGNKRTIYTAPTKTGPEWGLTSVQAAPDFNETGAVYVMYTWGDEDADPYLDNVTGEMRLVRVENGEEESIFTYEATRGHNGGRILIHHDLLYVTNGDHKDEEKVQDPSTLNGKILRMTLDGEPAPGNPGATNADWNPYVYTMGHRNPFGISWDAVRHTIVLSSPGQGDNGEVNLLTKGENYGWPDCVGPCRPPNPDYVDPVYAWPETAITPVSAVAVGGDIYVGGYSDKILHRVHETENGWEDDPIITHITGILSVARSPDGEWLYVGSWGGMHRYPMPQVSVDKLDQEDWSVVPDDGEDQDNGTNQDPGDGNGSSPDGRAGPFTPGPGAAALVALGALAALAVSRRH